MFAISMVECTTDQLTTEQTWVRLAATVLSERLTESPPKKSIGFTGVFCLVSVFDSLTVAVTCFLGLGDLKNTSNVDFLGFSSSKCNTKEVCS